jgi:solute:Na+ symporter, SSS family
MAFFDWLVVAVYCLISIFLGVLFTKKASEGIESYFASGRTLSWWLAGTSMAATAFSSDTPLLITGIVRRKGIWGNWEVWALAISTMFAVFFFSRLWKRAGVLTEVELVEVRYSGKSAAFLRGFKALYWGVFYNAFIMGAWPMTGLAKVMQETTGWDKAQSILFCMALTTAYSSLSGFWGVILTDFFQYLLAMFGAILLAIYAVNACGGMPVIIEKLSHTDKLQLFPPLTGNSFTEVLSSPFGWLLSLVLVQWWAWKNTDGGGIIVQRIASCKNEKQAILAVLWFNVAQYALRSWPWIVTALASLILLPELTDHERAYPRLIAMLLPEGLRGLMVASFFAAFMSTMSTHLNWGSSYFVSDFYKRFVKRDASENHYVNVARISSFVLAAAAMGVAFFTESIGMVFTFILSLTAAIGPVYFLRWFWWRINPWSEIVATVVSLPIILIRPWALEVSGIPSNSLFNLLFMIFVSAAFWIPATFLTKPVEKEKLDAFFEKVNPPGLWQRIRRKEDWSKNLHLWVISTAALFAITIGPLKLLLGETLVGAMWCGAAAVLWFFTLRGLKETPEEKIKV